MSELGTLACGSAQFSCAANASLEHLAGSINRFSNRLVNYLNSDFNEETQNFGAFSARVVLENVCAALVGRLDPFRLLYLAEFQTSEGYDHGRPAKSGFKWTGDVLSEDKPAANLWNADQDGAKISRALFSPHSEHVYWKPAVTNTLDFVNQEFPNAEFSEILSLEPDNFVSKVKGKSATLYSALSKGVHWDFFTSAAMFDEPTIKDKLRDCLILTGQICLISHFIPTAYRSLDHRTAVEAYEAFRGTFE